MANREVLICQHSSIVCEDPLTNETFISVDHLKSRQTLNWFLI